mgnify:FL=1
MECLLRPRLLALAVASTAALDCNAAGFALMEQNASGLGNAYAGAAAVAEDASTVWWNPAGMALLPAGRQVVFSTAQIVPSTTFHNAGSVAASGQALNGEGGDAGKAAFVPTGYFVMDEIGRAHV